MRNCDERKPRQQTQDTNYWKSQITKLTRRQSKPTESEMLQNYCQMVASHPGLSVNIMLDALPSVLAVVLALVLALPSVFAVVLALVLALVLVGIGSISQHKAVSGIIWWQHLAASGILWQHVAASGLPSTAIQPLEPINQDETICFMKLSTKVFFRRNKKHVFSG